MKSSLIRRGPFIALALWCFAALSFAQNSTLTYSGAQGTAWCGGSKGCTATGFYDGSINNVSLGPSQQGGPGFISDDYSQSLSMGKSWSANGINVASLSGANLSSQTMFGSSIGMNGYAELAFLVNQMFSTHPSALVQQGYSEALWYITSAGKLSYFSLSLTAKVLVIEAIAYVSLHGNSLSQYANLWLYNPTGAAGGEMWGKVSVPEGGAAFLYLLLAAMACLGAMLFRSRPNRTPKMA
jgi:hypothetical protein